MALSDTTIYPLEVVSSNSINAKFGGRVIGSSAINAKDFATYDQINGIYLPLTGGTLTGALTGTEATFSNGTDGFVNANRLNSGYATGLRLKTTTANTVNPTASNQITIFDDYATRNYVGRIDEPCIYNKALSQTEISTHYNSGSGITL